MPVQQLADHFDMRRPSVSEHLKVLRDAGLVGERRMLWAVAIIAVCVPVSIIRFQRRD